MPPTVVSIVLEFAGPDSCAVDMVADLIIGSADISAGVLATCLLAVSTALTFVTAPSEEPMPFS